MSKPIREAVYTTPLSNSNDQDIYTTVDYMWNYALRDVDEPLVKATVARLKGKTNIDTLHNIFTFVHKTVHYALDPAEHEQITAPIHFLNGNVKSGDCDCMTTLLVCLLEAAGFESAITVVAWRLVECEGAYYFDSKNCATINNNSLLPSTDPATMAADAVAAAAGAALMSVATSLMDPPSVISVEDIAALHECKCTDTSSPLEQQLVCEAWKTTNITCESESDVVAIGERIKSYTTTTGITRADCKGEWCAMFVADRLLVAYDKLKLDKTALIKALQGFYGRVDDMVKWLESNGVASVCTQPKAGAIFYRKSYTNPNANNHTGIVICVDNEQNLFWTIEGNAQRADGTYLIHLKDGNNGNNVEVAKNLYETGYFDYAQPDFYRKYAGMPRDKMGVDNAKNNKITLRYKLFCSSI